MLYDVVGQLFPDSLVKQNGRVDSTFHFLCVVAVFSPDCATGGTFIGVPIRPYHSLNLTSTGKYGTFHPFVRHCTEEAYVLSI